MRTGAARAFVRAGARAAGARLRGGPRRVLRRALRRVLRRALRRVLRQKTYDRGHFGVGSSST
ncbi:hypothetical protein E8A74_43035 [Polyangium fumosum]|uniref:Uncharacterized protein n=1 Tax=Polyangium fumosum TaxID=889272 RepID=A0A4U1IUG1_9BACT|nr:hypothetical protein E8A74_43035 [Polyangium fumosum]